MATKITPAWGTVLSVSVREVEKHYSRGCSFRDISEKWRKSKIHLKSLWMLTAGWWKQKIKAERLAWANWTFPLFCLPACEATAVSGVLSCSVEWLHAKILWLIQLRLGVGSMKAKAQICWDRHNHYQSSGFSEGDRKHTYTHRKSWSHNGTMRKSLG